MGRKPKNPFEQDFVTFHADDHSYIDKENNKYISVSQLIHLYEIPFDESGIILTMCAKREGIDKEVLRKRWNDKRDLSCLYGSAVHAEIEHFINTKKIRKSANKEIVENFKNDIYPTFEYPVFSEVLVYSKDLLVSGLSDFVEYNKDKNEIRICDLKTNESLTKKAYNKLLYPLNHLKNDAITRYSLQLSLYSYLLSLQGYNVNKNLNIFWVNPADKKIEIIKVDYMKKDIMTMLEHYSADAF
jgi:hypothetical protein